MSETVIIYDHFVANGGAENVSLLLVKELSATIETSWCDHELFTSELKNKVISVSVAGANKPRSSLWLSWYYCFRYRLPKSENVIISGLFAPLSLLRANPRQKHIVYFHMFPVFINWSDEELKKNIGAVPVFVYKMFIFAYRKILARAVAKADCVFCNSAITQERFREIGIKAKVLYPPVILNGLRWCSEEDYFLSTARVEASKRLPVILSCFKGLPDIPLKVIGGGSMFDFLREQFQDCSNIEFLGWMKREELDDYYSHCKALIYLPENEAFGIAPVEAMAAGKKTIGVAEGGLMETLSSPELADLIVPPVTVEKLRRSVLACGHSSTIEIEERQRAAKLYQASNFVKGIKMAINS